MTDSITPRMLTRIQAAEWCNVSPNTFDKWVREGVAPKPMRGTKRWYIKAMEQYFDMASGIAPSNDDDYDPELEKRIEQWGNLT